MYQINFNPKALKEFNKLEKDLQKRIINSLERIRIKPERYVIKLIGNFGYRLRIGDYRIIMDIYKEKSVILVTKIGHRKNIYQDLD